MDGRRRCECFGSPRQLRHELMMLRLDLLDVVEGALLLAVWALLWLLAVALLVVT